MAVILRQRRCVPATRRKPSQRSEELVDAKAALMCSCRASFGRDARSTPPAYRGREGTVTPRDEVKVIPSPQTSSKERKSWEQPHRKSESDRISRDDDAKHSLTDT